MGRCGVGVPLEVTGGEQQADPEAVLAGAAGRIEGRSLGQIAWMRLKRDKVAIAAGITILVLIALALLAPLITRALGTSPNEFNSNLIDPVLSTPKGSFGGISLDHPLGIEPVNGRDVLGPRPLRRADLAAHRLPRHAAVGDARRAARCPRRLQGRLGRHRSSAGRWTSSSPSRCCCSPSLSPASSRARRSASAATALRIAVLVFIIGFFSWPYMGRIIRGQTLSLREREFIDAARQHGRPHAATSCSASCCPTSSRRSSSTRRCSSRPTSSSRPRCRSSASASTRPPRPGAGCSTRPSTSTASTRMFMIVPGAAIFLTVMAFNLLGDGLRDALDPRGR